MKNRYLLFILLVMAFSSAKAQFPAPTNFDFSYNYIMIDDAEYCNGTYLIGPAYCTSFNWTAPDMSSTSATLSYYKVHYRYDNSMGGNPYDTSFVTVNTNLTLNIGIIGWIWVTAVYSNPSGESDSSNVQYNSSLPIGMPENEAAGQLIFSFDGSFNTLIVRNPNDVVQLRVINSDGSCSREINTIAVRNYLTDLKRGVYFVEAVLKNHTRIYKKIIIS